ncbi:MAG: cation-efflux pump [Nitrososphaeria archaeon]|nr:cation-efflux pump [Nitrososphaeria archaeon]
MHNSKFKALKLSFYAILSVVLVEFLGGLLANSMAVLSDSAHALFDALTTFWLIYAVKLSLKPPDEEHTYGHSKIEPLGSLFGGLSLMGISLFILYEAIIRFLTGTKLFLDFAPIALFSVLYTMVVDVYRIYILSKNTAIIIRANLLHAIADFSSTIIALLGVSAAWMGFSYADSLASIILSILLGFLSIRLIYASALELSDIAPKKDYQKIKSIIEDMHDIKGFKSFRMRKVGDQYFVEMTILLSSKIGIEKAHEIISMVEEKISDAIKNVTTTIHYEPIEEELSLTDKIEKIALKNGDVKGVHQIIVTKTKDGYILTLHIEMDPNMPLSKAHQISEKIEEEIKTNFPMLQKTTIHIESYPETGEGEIIYDDHIINQILKILNLNKKVKKVSSIRMYKSSGKKYIDITCSFPENLKIDEVHKEISYIEDMIRTTLGEYVVTIHPEPYKLL